MKDESRSSSARDKAAAVQRVLASNTLPKRTAELLSFLAESAPDYRAHTAKQLTRALMGAGKDSESNVAALRALIRSLRQALDHYYSERSRSEPVFVGVSHEEDGYRLDFRVAEQTVSKSSKRPTVFVSGSAKSKPLIDYLRAALSSDLAVAAWADAPFSLVQPPLAQYTQSLADADFVVVLLDLAGTVRQRNIKEAHARDNVLFELGLFVGRLGADRVLIVDTSDDPKSFRLPTDLSSLTILRSNTSSQQYDLERLAHVIAEEVHRRVPTIRPNWFAETTAYSCFISYSHQDEKFASKLSDDLGTIGVRCWLDRHELRVGESISEQVQTALRATDKFIAIFSSASVHSRWFEAELRQAIEIETQRETTVLIPVRIDDAVLTAEGQLWVALRDRLMGDFRDWESADVYNKAFRRLALNLAASTSESRLSGAPNA